MLTTEGWSEIYFKVSDVSSKLSFLFFIFIIIIGNWLLLQLIVATVVQSLKSQIKINKKYNIQKSKTFIYDETSKYHSLKHKLKNFINNPWVESIILFITILDTVFICMVNSDISGKLSSSILYIEIACTTIFALEMIIKIIVMGFIGYWKSSIYNVMDGIFTILSILEILLSNDSGIAVFRILRAFRILRLTKFLPQLSNLISVFCDSAKPLFSLFIIWILSIIIFSLFTIQFFQGGMNLFDNKPKNNLENFYYSFLSVVQLYTVENWDTIKDNVYESKGIYATLIPVIIIIVGAYIFSQFLVAILLNSFIDRLQSDELYKKISYQKENTGHIIKYVLEELFETSKKNKSNKDDKDNTPSHSNEDKTGSEDITDAENSTEQISDKIEPKPKHEIINVAGEHKRYYPTNSSPLKKNEPIPKSYSVPIELNQNSLLNTFHKKAQTTNMKKDNINNFEILSSIAVKNDNNCNNNNDNNNNNNNNNNNKQNKGKEHDFATVVPMFDIYEHMNDDQESEPSQSQNSHDKKFNVQDTPLCTTTDSSFNYSESGTTGTPLEEESQKKKDGLKKKRSKFTIKISDAKENHHIMGGGKTNVPHIFSQILKENKEASEERKKVNLEEMKQIENERPPSPPKLIRRIRTLKQKRKTRHIVSDSQLGEQVHDDLKDFFGVKTEPHEQTFRSLDITEMDSNEIYHTFTSPSAPETHGDIELEMKPSTEVEPFNKKKLKYEQFKDAIISKVRKIHKEYRESYFVHICFKTIKNDIYFYIIGIVTIASCISLALETPNPKDSKYYYILYKCDIFYTIVFIIDLLINIIAYGALFTRRAYLKKMYNWIDVAVVLISLLNVLGYGNKFHSLRIFRLVRILKFFKIHDGLRIVSTSVWKTIPSLFVALIPYAFYLLICSSVSLSLFVNRGWECNDKTIYSKEKCVNTYITNTNTTEPRIWHPYPVTYDNFFDSLLSSFIISHQEGWPDIMYRYMDSVDPTDNTGNEHHLGYSVFFVFSVLIGNWLFLAVVTALIFNNLKRNQDILRGIQVSKNNNIKPKKKKKNCFLFYYFLISHIPIIKYYYFNTI